MPQTIKKCAKQLEECHQCPLLTMTYYHINEKTLSTCYRKPKTFMTRGGKKLLGANRKKVLPLHYLTPS
jgi:hypothetical protein